MLILSFLVKSHKSIRGWDRDMLVSRYLLSLLIYIEVISSASSKVNCLVVSSNEFAISSSFSNVYIWIADLFGEL